jgi:uncharacterized protein (TIGR03067 family)
MNLFAALALASFVGAPVPKDAIAKPDQEALQGEWKVVEFVKDGSDRAKDEGDTKVVIKDNNFTVKEPTRDEPATFTIDPKANPKTIDIRVMEKGGKEVAVKGIYKLEKDKLTICYSFEDAARPKEFKSEANSKTGLLVLERVKK